MDTEKKNYMNVFEHYEHNQKRKLPHENDITRGLARVLNDNIYIFKMFIELVQNKLKDKKSDINLGDIKNKYDVDIQTRIKDIETENIEIEKYTSIIGVALTAKEFEIELKKTEINENRITDIIIENFNETLIIIEAKKTGENCTNQLSEQINSIKVENKISDANKLVISIEWEDIIEILDDYKNNSRIRDVIIDDYYEYLNFYFKEWFKVNKLELCDNDKELDKRLKRLLQDVQAVDNSKSKIGVTEIKNNGLGVNWKWTNYIPFKMNKDNNELIIEFYPSSSANQYKELIKKSSLKFMSESSKDVNLTINNEQIKIKFEKKAFIRIGGTMSHGIDNIYVESNKEKDFYEQIDRSVSGQWNLNQNTELYEKQIKVDNQNNSNFYEVLSTWDKETKSKEELKVLLSEKLVTKQNERYKQLNVCLGFSIVCKIKIDDLKKYDEDFDYRKECNNGLARPIRDFIFEIKKYIES